MEQLIAHLVGDYCLQNHWMALRKTERKWAAIIHAAFYTLPFLVLTQSIYAIIFVWSTHALIDHFRVAKYWVNFWGIGTEGTVLKSIMRLKKFTEGDGDNILWWVRQQGHYLRRIDDAPPFLGVWLLILVDNTMHLCCNYVALRWM